MYIKEAIKNMMEKNLIDMNSNIEKALGEKAIQKLEEKKVEIAKNYFGQK